MIRMCKRKQIDMIITKSISRFSRNTVDCLNYVRMLKQLDVDVFFEEQGIHSKDAGAEFYITIYGSIAQSESENISANVRWGIQQRAKEGRVHFAYSIFLGYKEDPDGKPMIEEEQADTVKFIFNEYLLGSSLADIAKSLTAKNIKTPSGKTGWNGSTGRCTWNASGEKKIVWRCINRLDYGKKYCHHSPRIAKRNRNSLNEQRTAKL